MAFDVPPGNFALGSKKQSWVVGVDRKQLVIMLTEKLDTAAKIMPASSDSQRDGAAKVVRAAIIDWG